jgi:hypothetical protein
MLQVSTGKFFKYDAWETPRPERLQKSPGGPYSGEMTATTGETLINDFAAVISFALSITCTPDPDLARRLMSPDGPASAPVRFHKNSFRACSTAPCLGSHRMQSASKNSSPNARRTKDIASRTSVPHLAPAIGPGIYRGNRAPSTAPGPRIRRQEKGRFQPTGSQGFSFRRLLNYGNLRAAGLHCGSPPSESGGSRNVRFYLVFRTSRSYGGEGGILTHLNCSPHLSF